MSEIESQVFTAIVVKGISAMLSKAMSPSSTAKNPYDAHMESIDRRLAKLDEQKLVAPKTYENTMTGMKTAKTTKDAALPENMARDEVGVACLACARAHFATISGTLKEALRFAREDESVGILHPEVQTRLQTAEEDVTIVERHDWTPEKIMASPPEEQAVIREMLQKLRELRQDIVQIDSVEDLESSAAKSGMLSNELRLQVLKSRGLDASKIVNLAKQVESGELTLEEARNQLKAQIQQTGNE